MSDKAILQEFRKFPDGILDRVKESKAPYVLTDDGIAKLVIQAGARDRIGMSDIDFE